MTAPAGLGLQFAVAKWLTDRLAGGRKDSLLPAAGQEWARGARIPVKAPDGTLLAWVSVTDPADPAEVGNLDHLTDWVGRRFPGEIVQVPAIRPSFLNALKAEVARFGGYVVKPGDGFADPGGDGPQPGDVVPVPGLARRPGVPQVRTELQDGAGEILGRLLGPLAGLLDWVNSPDRPALPAADGNAGTEGVAE